MHMLFLSFNPFHEKQASADTGHPGRLLLQIIRLSSRGGRRSGNPFKICLRNFLRRDGMVLARAPDDVQLLGQPLPGGVLAGELLAPQERLIAMLLAFERFLAVRDGKVARVALDRIGATLRQSGTDPGEVRTPNGARVVLTSERDLARVEVNLLDAPDLAEIRADVDWLIRQLQPRDGGLR